MKGTRVLIVEDQAIVARDLERRLAGLDYEVVGAAHDAEECLRLTASNRPELVLMDIRLPGPMDGIEAAVAIRDQFGTPVVFLTAFAEEETLLRARAAEPYGYLLKPFADRELRASVEVALHKHAVEARLRANEEIHRTVLDTALDGYFLIDEEGRFLEVNEAYARMTGYTQEELLSRRVADLEADESAEEVTATIGDVFDAGSARFERRQRRKDGSLIDLEISVRCLGGPRRSQFCFVRDVTRRKQLESERELDRRLLQVSSRTTTLDEFMAGATGVVREWLGCDRVAINVREGDSFRHFENHGDPACFSVSADTLCPLDRRAPFCRALAAHLGEGECLCARLLAGTTRPPEGSTEPALPGFTERGSFWTAEGPGSVMAPEPGSVSGDGADGSKDGNWGSIALVPVQANKAVIGLLQILDRRPGRWDAAAVAVYERLADQIGIGIGQHLAQEALQRSQARYRTLFEGMTQGVVFQDATGAVVAMNPTAERILGAGSESLLGRDSNDPRWGAVGDDGSPLPGSEHPAMVALRTGVEVRNAILGLPHPTRAERIWIEVTAVPQFQPGATRPYQVFTMFQDVTERRRMATALRDSEARYRRLVESFPDAIVVHAHGPIVFANQAAASLLGAAAPDDLLGRNAFDFVHPESLGEVRDRAATVRDGERSGVHEERLIRLDGSTVEVEASAVALRFEGRAAIQITGRDITRRKRAEAELRRNEAVQRARLELSDAAGKHGLDELLRRTVDEAETVTGSTIGFLHFIGEDEETVQLQVWSSRTLAGGCQAGPEKRHYPLMSAGIWADCLRQRRTVVHEGLPGNDAARIWPAGHVKVDREILVPVIRGDRVVAILGVGNKPVPYEPADAESAGEIAEAAWDLVLRKQAEEALRASESSYRGLFDTIRLAVYIQDSQGRFLDVNEGAVSMYGYSREEFLQRTPDFLAAPGRNDAVALGEKIQGAFRGVPQQFEFWGRRRNGEVFPKDVRLCRGTYHGKEVVIAVAADISESRRLEERVQQLQKMEAIGQLAGGIAHDFNNILAAMSLQIGLLEMHLAGEPDRVSEVRELGLIADRAATLTRQLLTFSRRAPLQARDLDLNALVEEMTKMLGRLLGETIDLEFVGAPRLPAIHADPGMMQQVILNLCVNSRDAMPAGGRLELRTMTCVLEGSAAAGHPEAGVGSFVCLQVRDTGCGMDAETRRRIFEPFFTSKAPGKGTGLGLSIVYGIVRQHGGWIDVESESGRGTVFRVYFPVPAEARVGAPAFSPRRPVGGSETLLLVEDNEALRRSLSTYLRHLGYTVLEAIDGPSALEVWAVQGPAIAMVLTDMVMPSGMNGLELTARLRSGRPTLPVIVSSGYSEELVAGDPAVFGVTFLSKPYPPSELASAIRRCLASAPKPPQPPDRPADPVAPPTGA